jgi:hypothetical protein
LTKPPAYRLNAADRFMLVIDRAVRGLGGPGFETVTFVWLDGRADRGRLLRGLAELNRACPVVTARLRECVPCWDVRPGAEVTFRETHLPAADRQAVLDHAAGLFAGETDPAAVDPMRFHLLHLPDGRDVFLAQYSHVLLDHARAVGVIRRLDEPAAGGPAPDRWRDPVWAYLRRFPRHLRHRAAGAAEGLRRALRGGAIRLGSPAGGDPGAARYGVLTRGLTPEQTRAVEDRARRAAGTPHLSMALLASALRGIDRLTAGRPGRGNYFQVGLPLDLGLKGRPADAIENLSTLVPLRVPPGAAADRDGLLRELARQLREALTARTDLGILELVSVFGRRRHRASWALDLLMRYTLSLWYSYLGPVRLGPRFLGCGVAEAFSAGPTWPAVGATLLANRFADRLHLQLTYMPHSAPAPLAADYLDGVVEDLLGEG